MKTVDSSGVVVNEYEYDVYGTLRSSSGRQDNEFQFAGQQTDPTGLQYLRARYYDMETGRFISRDPMAASAAWMESPFAYASANAVNLSDPLGLCSKFKPWQCGDEALRAAKDGWNAVKNTAGDARDCLSDVQCSANFATTLDIVAATLDTGAAAIVNVTTIAGCVSTGPIGCMIGYAAGTAIVQPILAVSNIASTVSTVAGCAGLLLGSEKDGGGFTPANALDCGTSVATWGAGWLSRDANVSAALANYQLCRDLGRCRP
jgi:RHS repeat-associated protein